MRTKSAERGSAIFELMMLMIGAAALIAVMNKWFVQPFLRHEAQWVGWADQVHRHVGHAVCLENLPEKFPVTYVGERNPICVTP